MITVLGVVAGLFFATIICEPLVRFSIRQVRIDASSITEPESPFTRMHAPFVGDRGARWVGGLERVLFFVGFLQESPELVAGWLLFKVASKWESWQNIIRVPESLDGVDSFEFLRYRHAWGVKVMQRFLIGTLSNILAAIAGVAVTRWIQETLGG